MGVAGRTLSGTGTNDPHARHRHRCFAVRARGWTRAPRQRRSRAGLTRRREALKAIGICARIPPPRPSARTDVTVPGHLPVHPGRIPRACIHSRQGNNGGSPCPKHHRRLHRRKPAFARRKSDRKKGMQPGNNTKPRVAPFGKRPNGCGPCGSPRRPRKRRVKFPPSRVPGDPSKLRFPSPVPTAGATWTEATSTSAFRRFHRPPGSRSADSA